jgi:hypothetical protein
MAERLGLRRYFQTASIPHYDCCQAKRAIAIQHGAIVIDRRQVAALVRTWRLHLQMEVRRTAEVERLVPTLG